jgi:two-component system response regulator YesN
MFSVLIVDDEYLERRGLRKHFDWQAHGMEVAGEAENGVEALRFLENRPVDFLVTDVSMPVMDGIELAREVKKRYPLMKILFISGYNDLEYLKGALKVEAVDYLFKAIDLAEMSQTVRRVTAELSGEKQKEDLLRNMEHQLQRSIPCCRRNLTA